ncbi:MAG: hypothetical protein WCC32_14900 [Terriglobales bacterium]
MQTLNVGAGRTDQEYLASEEARRADLRADSQDDANYFFWAAGVVLLPVRLNFLVNIGTVDLLRFYGKDLGHSLPLAVLGAEALWIAILVALGFAARSGHRWAFFAGMALYAVDMIALIVTFSMWAFGVHAFFMFRWFQGQKALKDLSDASA